jgi:putative heme-binding domain-containing protein
VSRHVLSPKGATFASKTTDFVVSDNPDFHPTDVVMDADGSLLIVDTGGWYKLCCPTSQLVKPDVLGAIYRVRKVGAKGPDDPWGLGIDWMKAPVAELAPLLGDSRPMVRQRAKSRLIDLGPPAVKALKRIVDRQSPTVMRREALWTLIAIDTPEARKVVSSSLAENDETARQVALHGISRTRDTEAIQDIEILAPRSSANLRAIAECLGKMAVDSERRTAKRGKIDMFAGRVVGDIVRILDDIDVADPFLEHACIWAMIEIDSPHWIASAFDDATTARSRFAAIAAAKYLRVPQFKREIESMLADGDREHRDFAWWCIQDRDWAPAAIDGMLRTRPVLEMFDANREELASRLAAMSGAAPIRRIVARLASSEVDAECKVGLSAIARSNLRDTPEEWIAALTACLGRPTVRGQAIECAQRLKLPEKSALAAEVDRMAEDVSLPPRTRLLAMAAKTGKSRPRSDEAAAFLRSQLDDRQAVENRQLAVNALSRTELTSAQLAPIADMIPKVGPLEVDRLLELFAGQKDAAVGARLMNALEQPKLAGSLRVDSLERRLKNFGPAVQERAAKLYARLNADLAGQRAHLEDLLTKLPAGDVRRGQAVFNRAKSVCAACHTIGYVGGKTGPDLTRIGSIRTKRDLLEAVVFPSASFVRGYEPIVIVTTDGKTHNGLIRTENADEITLTTGPNQEDRIAKKEVESMQPGRVSVMPAGLEQQMSALDLADLVAFLQACR